MAGYSVFQVALICLLVFLAGFVDSIAGGGGLISLPAYMIAGFPVHMAIGTNKCSSMMGTVVSTFRYAKSGYVKLKEAVLCIVCAFAGSTIGANIALMIDDYYFKVIMLFILPLTAVYVTKSKSMLTQQEPIGAVKTMIIAMLSAFVIGIYDGFYGPGTGTFLILLLTGLAHLPLTNANGIAKVTNLSTNVAAFVVYMMNGKIIFVIGILAGIFSIAGNYIGTKMFDKNGARITRPIMLVVLAIFFVKVLKDLFF